MNNRLNIWKILFLLFLAAGSIYVIRKNYKEQSNSAIQSNVPYINNKGNIFGTYYSITYSSVNDLHGKIKKTLSRVDNSLSPFNKNSLISAINENRDTVADEMFTKVFTLAQQVSQETEGAFDITVAPLVNAWGFGFKNGFKVDSATVDSLCKFVGYNKISLNNRKISKLHPETMLDCSAVAKGYGCDAVAQMLLDEGVCNFMVEIGGEIVTHGHNSKGKAWSIGISKPNDNAGNSSNGLQEVISITGKGMATSGNYRNFRIENGRKIAHTIDPRTGYPVQHSLLSATVVAPDCATADALATAFMVMGVEKAKEYCSRHNNIEAFFIYANEKGETTTTMTAGFNNYIED